MILSKKLLLNNVYFGFDSHSMFVKTYQCCIITKSISYTQHCLFSNFWNNKAGQSSKICLLSLILLLLIVLKCQFTPHCWEKGLQLDKNKSEKSNIFENIKLRVGMKWHILCFAAKIISQWWTALHSCLKFVLCESAHMWRAHKWWANESLCMIKASKVNNLWIKFGLLWLSCGTPCLVLSFEGWDDFVCVIIWYSVTAGWRLLVTCHCCHWLLACLVGGHLIFNITHLPASKPLYENLAGRWHQCFLQSGYLYKLTKLITFLQQKLTITELT